MYGTADNGKSLYKDERVQPIVKELAEKLKWSESLIGVSTEKPTESQLGSIAATPASQPLDTSDGKPVTFLGPADGKILRGTDGRLYAIEYQRSQPVDSYWLQQLIQKKNLSKVERSDYFGTKICKANKRKVKIVFIDEVTDEPLIDVDEIECIKEYNVVPLLNGGKDLYMKEDTCCACFIF